MKGLTVTAPYGTLIAIAQAQPELGKHHETRSWSTGYRGWLAIHQGKGLDPVGGDRGLYDLCDTEPFRTTLRVWNSALKGGAFHAIDNLHRHRGAIVAVARLVECYQILPTGLRVHSTIRPLPTGNDRAFGDYTPGRFAWALTDICALPVPVACRGALGLWDVPAEVEAQVWAQVERRAA